MRKHEGHKLRLRARDKYDDCSSVSRWQECHRKCFVVELFFIFSAFYSTMYFACMLYVAIFLFWEFNLKNKTKCSNQVTLNKCNLHV